MSCMRIICVRMYSGVCMCVCMRNGRANGRRCAHTHAHTTGQTVQRVLTACIHGLAFALKSNPIARKRPCSSFFTFLRAHVRMEERLCMCVYAELKSERHCARTHAHTTPHRLAASLFLILLLPSRARENGRARDTARTYACTASLVLTSSACLGTNCMARSTRRIQDRTHAHTASSERAELRVHCRAGCCDGFGRGPHARTARSEASELRAAG